MCGFFFRKERERGKKREARESERLFHCNLKIDTHRGNGARHVDFFQLETRGVSSSSGLHQFHAGIGRLGCIFYMRLARPSSRQRSDQCRCTRAPALLGTLCSPPFVLYYPSPYFKFSFFLTVSMQLCGKSIADTSLRLRDVNFRAHKRGARYNVYVHTFFLLLFFY